jgi:hypothetical protein
MQFLRFYQNTDSLNMFDFAHSGHLLSVMIAVVRMREDMKGVSPLDRHSHWHLVKDTVSFVENYAIRLFRVLTSSHLEGSYDQVKNGSF